MKIVNLVCLLVLFISCNTDTTKEFDAVNGLVNKTSGVEIAFDEKVEAEEYSVRSSGRNNEAPNQEIQEQKIIKTVHLVFETETLEDTHKNILALVKKNNARVQNDNSGKEYHRIYHRLTIRVPSKNFDAVLAGISQGVAYFDRKDVSQKDVTEEFVDIEARLKAKHALEKRYLQLLTQAKNVKDMLAIEHQLATIREEIESKQGRLKYLQSQVSMSTIHLEFYKTTVETGVTKSYGQKMKHAFQNGWQGISSFFLGILTLWPLVLFIILCILLVRRYLKKRKKNKK